MIKETTKIQWNKATKGKYVRLGYEFTKYNDVFECKVSDLSKSSHVKVDVICDYCGKEYSITYKDYNKAIDSNEIKKTACKDCDEFKKREMYLLKHKRGELTKNDKGYYTIKENRIKELELFINQNESIDNLQQKNKTLYVSIMNYDKITPLELALECGFEKIKITKYKDDYYDDLNNLIKDIEKIVKSLGRFPTLRETLLCLQTNNNKLLQHGGIDKIKDIMGYNDKKDLIDSSGFQNRSVYEFIVSEYIHNNTDLNILREQHPFDGEYKNLRSDFTFEFENEIYHIEVWGVLKKDKSSTRAKTYNEKRIFKEKLYNENNINLISIDCEYLLPRKSQESKYAYLHNKFYKFLKYKKEEH